VRPPSQKQNTKTKGLGSVVKEAEHLLSMPWVHTTVLEKREKDKGARGTRKGRTYANAQLSWNCQEPAVLPLYVCILSMFSVKCHLVCEILSARTIAVTDIVEHFLCDKHFSKYVTCVRSFEMYKAQQDSKHSILLSKHIFLKPRLCMVLPYL
jgi:hypothetical protein